MNLISKIKSYFVNNKLHAWTDFELDSSGISFRRPDSEAMLEVTSFINSNLHDTSSLGNLRYRLKPEAANMFTSLNDLMCSLNDILQRDLEATSAESMVYNWSFSYFLAPHPQCSGMLSLSTVLSRNGDKCVYTLATMQKFNQHYYCWNRLDDR